MDRVLKRVGLVGIAIIFALLVGEFILRLLHIHHTLTGEWLLSGTSSHIQLSDKYIIEKTDLPHHMDSDAFRIVALGDSFTQADMWEGVVDYPTILADLVAANRYQNVKLYNFGVAGTGSDQQMRYFLDHILPLKPNVVIWQMYSNDVWENVIYPVYTIDVNGLLTPLDVSKNWAYLRQKFYQSIPAKDMLSHSYLLNLVLYGFESMQYSQVPSVYRQNFQEWGVQKMRLAVAEMERLSHEAGFSVYYVLIPSQAVYLNQAHADYDSNPERFYRSISTLLQGRDNYIPISFSNSHNTENVLGSSADISPATYYYLHGEDQNALGDRHLNDLGQHEAARQIFDAIRPLLPVK